MKRLNSIFALFFILTSFISAQSQQRAPLDDSVSPKAQELIKSGVKLVELEDKIAEALAKLKEAIAIAPNSIKAHSEYVRLRSYWLDKEPEVQAEYESLMKKEPNNPVYPLALALGQIYGALDLKLKWLAKVAELAPDTIWGKYAKARTIEKTDPDAALAAYLDAIEKNPSQVYFYTGAFPLLVKQKKFAEADALLAKEKSQSELKTPALNSEWNLQLAKTSATDANKKLGEDLKRLLQTSDDMETLIAVRNRLRALRENEAVKAAEEKISRLDSTWYPQRGQISFDITLTGKMSRHFYAGRQSQTNEKLNEISTNGKPTEQTNQMEQLLSLQPQPSLKDKIHRWIFDVAIKNKNADYAAKYGELVLKEDSEDLTVLVGLAKLCAGVKNDFKKAEAYSQKAMDLTNEFHLITERPAFIPETMFKTLTAEDKQKARYNDERLSALNARADVLSASGKYMEAEAILQQSLKIKPTEDAYAQLSKVLRKLNRAAEADQAAIEAETLWRKEVVAGFKTEPIKDFELTTVKGEKVKLSDLKGKLVMINFWATWCVPCVKEMPILAELYDKYKAQGLEILAVSGDVPEDKFKIAPFAEKNKLAFPVMFGENVPSLYDVHSYPTTIFVDRAGNIKYRSSGLDGENAKRNIEFIISELMKSES